MALVYAVAAVWHKPVKNGKMEKVQGKVFELANDDDVALLIKRGAVRKPTADELALYNLAHPAPPPAPEPSLSTSASTSEAAPSLSTSASTGVSTAQSGVASLSTSASTGVSTAQSGVASLSTSASTSEAGDKLLG